jgi:transposase
MTEAELKLFSLFIKMKRRYKNSCVYGFSYRKLALKVGISVSSLQKCIPIFRRKGWISEHNGNLVFKRIGLIDEAKGKVVQRFYFDVNEKYTDILKRLKLRLLQQKHDQFMFVKKVISEHNYSQVWKNAKWAMKMAKKHDIDTNSKIENKRFSITNKNIGKIIGKSKSSASRLVKWGNENGILKIKRNYKVLTDKSAFFNGSWNDNLFVAKSGAVILQSANIINFSGFKR